MRGDDQTQPNLTSINTLLFPGALSKNKSNHKCIGVASFTQCDVISRENKFDEQAYHYVKLRNNSLLMHISMF